MTDAPGLGETTASRTSKTPARTVQPVEGAPIGEPLASRGTGRRAVTPPTPPREDYGAGSIQVLEGLEAVRKRPGMYIGSTGPRGLHHLVYEIVDNAVDESLAGYCDAIDVRILADGGIRVADNGRGIPVDIHPVEGRSTVEVVLTVLHAGGKFGGGGYAVSGGLHGVGSSVVNALSHRLDVEVRRQGHVWRQSYTDGVPNAPLAEGEEADRTGTTIAFWPNAEIFETVEFDYETLRTRFQQTAFLNKGLTIAPHRRALDASRSRARSRRTGRPVRGLPLRPRPRRLRRVPELARRRRSP